jgi:hypothetical protein
MKAESHFVSQPNDARTDSKNGLAFLVTIVVGVGCGLYLAVLSAVAGVTTRVVRKDRSER